MLIYSIAILPAIFIIIIDMAAAAAFATGRELNG
jgi:hypothetical protein